MSAMKIIGVVLIAAGTIALVHGNFSYKNERHEAQLGSLHLSVTDQKQVGVPKWASVGAIVAGGVLLLIPGKR